MHITTKKRLTLRLTARKVYNETIIMKQEKHEIMTVGNNYHYKRDGQSETIMCL